MKKLFWGFLAALLIASPFAVAQWSPLPLATGASGCSEASQMLSCFNAFINGLNQSVNPATFSAPTNPRNLIDNGAMNVQQRGTGARTCGTTTIPTTAYSADRWGCAVDVSSGAGTAVVVTTNVVAPFTNAQLFYRTSGALLQPQCIMQEIPSTRIIPLRGSSVTLSFYAYALAAMVTDNGGVMTANLVTGTGTDEGLQTLSTVTSLPAFTGAATQSRTVTLGTTMAQRVVSFQIPATAAEAAVALCWTPTSAAGAGATDGFEFTGVQLEPGAIASQYEFRNYAWELQLAQTYYVQWKDDLAATFVMPATCTETTSGTIAACLLMFPQTMRTTPAVVVTTAASFGMTKVADGTAAVCSALAVVASTATLNNVKVTCALSETAAVGTMHILLYAATGAANTLTVSADF